MIRQSRPPQQETASQRWIEAVRKRTHTGSDYAIAKLLGISQDAVNAYRKGTRTMGLAVIVKVAAVLQVPMDRIALDILAEQPEKDGPQRRTPLGGVHMTTRRLI